MLTAEVVEAAQAQLAVMVTALLALLVTAAQELRQVLVVLL
jgi:hypothetical protein